MATTDLLLVAKKPGVMAGAIWRKEGDAWRCVRAAPILNWMRHQSPEEARACLVWRGYEWRWLPATDDIPDPMPSTK